LAPLGAGGMGEVYRARDTRLDRTVAIKLLHSKLDASPELRARFEREARAVGALQHPNICVLHDIGEANGTLYLVMEHLEGETLAARLRLGPLPLDEIIRLGGQIAAALDRAHRAGIVHRDLKPANVMLTSSGAKLLDFGLAKATGSSAFAASSLAATAFDAPATMAGVVLGTVPYMSPEQLAGLQTDACTDIYALGCVLFEMATAQPAYAGLTTVEPPALDRLIRACLARSPEDRLQSARDVGWLLTQAALPTPAAASASQRRLSGWMIALAAALAIAGGLALWLTLRDGPAGPALPTQKFTLYVPIDQDVDGKVGQPTLALSPDGQTLAFVASGNHQIYLRRLDQFEASPLAGTNDADDPFFSPDGQWLGFFADNHLKKIRLSGGLPTALEPATNGRGAAWLPDGQIVFATDATSPLFTISSDGGAISTLTALEASHGDRSHRWPQAIANGRAILFSIGNLGRPNDNDDDTIAAYSFSTHTVTRLINGGAMARFLPDSTGAAQGTLVYVRAGDLYAARFDAAHLQLLGASQPLFSGVAETSSSGAAQFAVGGNGALAYVPGSIAGFGGSDLAWVTPSGKATTVHLSDSYRFLFPALSPNEARVALQGEPFAGGGSDIFVWDFIRRVLTRLTFDGHSAAPAWSPDGRFIAFRVVAGGKLSSGIYLERADGAGAGTFLAPSTIDVDAPSFSPDAHSLVFAIAGNHNAIQTLSPQHAPVGVPSLFGDGIAPRFSPDGRWIAYASGSFTSAAAFVQPFPATGAKWQLDTGQAEYNTSSVQPTWAPDGRAIYYRHRDTIMRVPVAPGSAFSAGAPVEVYQNPGLLAWSSIAGITRDNRMLLLGEFGPSTAPTAPAPVRLILHLPTSLAAAH
jgi:serine/threonine-protein kinase